MWTTKKIPIPLVFGLFLLVLVVAFMSACFYFLDSFDSTTKVKFVI